MDLTRLLLALGGALFKQAQKADTFTLASQFLLGFKLP